MKYEKHEIYETGLAEFHFIYMNVWLLVDDRLLATVSARVLIGYCGYQVGKADTIAPSVVEIARVSYVRSRAVIAAAKDELLALGYLSTVGNTSGQEFVRVDFDKVIRDIEDIACRGVAHATPCEATQ